LVDGRWSTILVEVVPTALSEAPHEVRQVLCEELAGEIGISVAQSCKNVLVFESR
jgi:hypothetical protein